MILKLWLLDQFYIKIIFNQTLIQISNNLCIIKIDIAMWKDTLRSLTRLKLYPLPVSITCAKWKDCGSLPHNAGAGIKPCLYLIYYPLTIRLRIIYNSIANDQRNENGKLSPTRNGAGDSFLFYLPILKKCDII